MAVSLGIFGLSAVIMFTVVLTIRKVLKEEAEIYRRRNVELDRLDGRHWTE